MNLTGETSTAGLREKVKILLVEDSPDDVFFFQRVLKKSGEECDYTHLADGGEAVELLESMARQESSSSQSILMFLDLKMPVLNGFDVLSWIREKGFPHPLHVVVLSGSDDPRDRERAQALGAADYLVKPISMRRLEEEIRAVRGDPAQPRTPQST